MTENNADQAAAESAVQSAALAGEKFFYDFFFVSKITNFTSQLAARSRVEGAEDGIAKVRI